MRFYADNNVVSMFPQGNSQGRSGEFGELRSYLLAQLMWNPYMSEEEYNRHMNEFLAAYYGEGWKFVREYIDITTRLASNGGYKLDGNENPTSAVCGQGRCRLPVPELLMLWLPHLLLLQCLCPVQSILRV